MLGSACPCWYVKRVEKIQKNMEKTTFVYIGIAKLNIRNVHVRQIFLSEDLTAKQLMSLSADPWAADKLVNLADIGAEQRGK